MNLSRILLNILPVFLYVTFPLFAEYISALYYNISHYLVFLTIILKGIILCIPFFVFKRKTKIILCIIYALVYIPALINVCHIILFKDELSTSSMLSIFETTFNETIDFISHFYSKNLLIFIILYLITPLMFIKHIAENYEKNTLYTIIKNKHKSVLFLLFLGGYYAFSLGDIRYRYPLERLVFTYIGYIWEHHKNIILRKNRQHLHYNNIKHTIKTNKKQTYIIVIGESVDKKHMSLYGYHRKTTPNFDKIKNELYVFKNVKSAACHTNEALKGILLFDNFANGDIVSFLNEAGFKTFWFSNQYSSGYHDTIAAMVGNQAGEFAFINRSSFRTGRTTFYDEAILKCLDKALKDPYHKKVIFIHLIGSHSPYSRRYPKEYDVFTDITLTKRANKVARYDNSILYTDSILMQIINKLKLMKDDINIMIYLSDHGEDCYDNDTCPFAHTSSISSPHMFDIPLILWASENFQQLRKNYCEKINVRKNYKTNVMIHSILDIFGLEHHLIRKEFSIFR